MASSPLMTTVKKLAHAVISVPGEENAEVQDSNTWAAFRDYVASDTTACNPEWLTFS